MSVGSRVQFNETIQPAGPGLREENIHTASGLRTQAIMVTGGTGLGQISGTSPLFGGAGGADVTSWTSLRTAIGSWGVRPPFPMTPSAFITCIDTGAKIRLRCRGYDQFGSAIVETTPWVSLTAGASNAVHLLNFSKVFSRVEDVEYMSSLINNSFSTLGIGWNMIVDPQRVETAVLTDAGNGPLQLYNTEQNWGIGTPLRVSPYGPNDYPVMEVLGAAGVNLSDDSARTVIPHYQAGRTTPTTSAGFRVGRSASGWQGTPHKIGFHSDNWATDKLGIELGGSSTDPDDKPDTLGEIGLDFVQFMFQVRTTLGTRRTHNATNVYVWG